MKKTSQKVMTEYSSIMKEWKLLPILLLMLIGSFSQVALAQNSIVVKGVVLDPAKEPIIGATIVLKSNPKVATSTDLDGKFSIQLPSGAQTLVVTYIGMNKKEIPWHGQQTLSVQLDENQKVLDEVVVVGYGQQKKESVVGAITQTTGKTLERAGGVNNLGMALTGNLPGVSTMSSTGMPGGEDPKILIRGISSWNNSDPLVLVDGIERSLSTVEISSVESISVLKDASATAIYGVKGANGVILITTKRGTEGKPVVRFKANTTLKAVSKLPEKYDSYDALIIKNEAIERELGLASSAWSSYTPMDIISKYRYPANTEEWDQYPNVDWQKVLFKDFATSYNLSANISGGSKLVNYFTGIDYVYEGDLYRPINNGRGYNSGWGYTRMNFRSNLDFTVTKSTKFSVNLFGSNGIRTVPWGYSSSDASFWQAIYRTAPDSFRPVYSDGTYGYYAPRTADQPNSLSNLAASGVEKRTTTQLTTDFILSQNLDMITKGLNVKADLSLDNTFVETARGINDLYNSVQRKYINPLNGSTTWEQTVNTGTQFDYFEQNRWVAQAGSVAVSSTYRKLYYSLQANYGRKFGNNNVALMGLFSRDKTATGSTFPHYREDWVGRATYDFASKYFFEANGAYNGSERFGKNHRFAFFPSLSGGWMVTNEDFMKKVKFIDMLKLRVSWGRIGDDNVSSSYLYSDTWSYSGTALFGDIPASSPYTDYRISSLGNPDVSWETVEKRNLGIDYGFLGGLVTGSLDIFKDRRYNILISGSSRAIPSYFGVSAPYANLGEVKTHGYELELKLNHTFDNGLRLWGNIDVTHAVNKIIYADDPELTPDYQKKAGYSINQTTAYINQGTYSTWDDIYGSTARSTNNANKLVGDYNILDINGDGVIDSNDKTPYEYSTNPQNTYSTIIGAEWKGFSVFVQFYGVNNVTREVTFSDFYVSSDVVYKENSSYWSKGSDGLPYPRWSTSQGSDASGTRYLFDGSYLRLKNAEIGYTFQGGMINKLKMKSCRLYLNGDNLLLWTKMPDDRESNFSNSASDGAYPTVKRFNLGVDITF